MRTSYLKLKITSVSNLGVEGVEIFFKKIDLDRTIHYSKTFIWSQAKLNLGIF